MVNIRSLEACEKWSQRQAYPVIVKRFPSVYHNDILVDAELREEVVILKSFIFYSLLFLLMSLDVSNSETQFYSVLNRA